MDKVILGYFMLVLGPLQVLISLIVLVATKNQKLRKYLAFYFLGVGIYFGLLTLATPVMETEYRLFYEILFFGGAGALAVYDTTILVGNQTLP